MISIVKADHNDAELLADIGRQTFIESHGHSASISDIEAYIGEKYNYNVFKKELEDQDNIYYKVLYNNELAGYSKIILDFSHTNISLSNVTKLERIYLLKDFYDQKLGSSLFRHNIEISKSRAQKGMWLYVWNENHRAVNFYTHKGFKIVGSHDFKISETHSNPNHQMLLRY